MRYKIALLIPLIFVLFAIGAHGAATSYCDWGSPLTHWNLTTADGLNLYDCTGNSPTNGVTNRTFTLVAGGVNTNANGTTFDNDRYNLTNSTFGNFGTDSFSVCFNASFSTVVSRGRLISHSNNLNDGWYISMRDDKKLQAYADTGYVWTHPLTFGQGQFYEICYVKNSSHQAIHTDGRYNVSAASVVDVDLNTGLYLGMESAEQFVGTMNLVSIYYYALSSQNISDRYAKVFLIPPPPPPEVAVFVNITKPIEDEHLNSPLIFVNVTSNLTALCSINDTRFTSHFSNSSFFSFVNNTDIGDGNVSIFANCTNSTGGQRGNSTRNFIVDTVIPTLTSDLEDSGKFVIAFQNTNLTATINASDTHLYSMTVNDTSGVIFNITNIPGNFFDYNLSIEVNKSVYSLGANTIVVKVADAHTAKYIPEWDVKKNIFTKALKFDWGWLFEEKFISINPLGNGLTDEFNANKEFDRYSLKHKPSKVKYELEYMVTSSHKIDIINHPDYEGWLVVGDLNKWVDFNIVNATGNEIYTTERINNNVVKVSITNLDGRETYDFNSVGELNIYTQNYTWYLTNATASFPVGALEFENSNYKLNITKVSGINTTATLLYNGTFYTPEKLSTDTVDYYNVSVFHQTFIGGALSNTVNVTWYFNLTSNDTTTPAALSSLITIESMQILHCSLGGNTTINFTVRDSDTNLFIGDFDFGGLFNIWNDQNPNIVKNFSFDNDTLASSFKLCIWPPNRTVNTDYRLLFQASGYENYNYNLLGTRLNTSITYLDVYMVNSSLSTEISINLVDENDEKLVGYSVLAYRYNLALNNFYLVDTEVSDSDGKVLFHLDVDNYNYKFEVKNPAGNLVYTEPTQKLISTAYTFRIPLGTTSEFIQQKIYNLDIVLNAHKLTKNFTLVWNSISYASNQIKLVVTKFVDNATANPVVLSTQTSRLGTGNIFYNITEDTTNLSVTYIGTVYVNSSDNGIEYVFDSKSIDFKKAWDIFGNESLIVAFLFIGTLMFIGLATSAEVAIFFTIFGLVASFYLGLYVISFSALIALIVGLVAILMKGRK